MAISKIFVASLLLLALGSCGDDLPEEITADPLARPTIAFAHERSHIESGGSGEFIQSSPATISTTYDVHGDDLPAAARDILRQAKEADWTLEAATETVIRNTDIARVWVSNRELTDGGVARLQISFSDSDLVEGELDYTKGSITVYIDS